MKFEVEMWGHEKRLFFTAIFLFVLSRVDFDRLAMGNEAYEKMKKDEFDSKNELCKSYAESARTIMSLHQSGVDMSKLMSVASELSNRRL